MDGRGFDADAYLSAAWLGEGAGLQAKHLSRLANTKRDKGLHA